MSIRSILSSLAPQKTVPVTPWTAKSQWDLSLRRVSILFFGLAIFGLGEALLIQGSIGNAPWSVFAQGLAIKTGLSIGLTTFIISVFVLLMWIPLKEKVGFGTLSNIVIIASFLQIGTIIFPKQTDFATGLAFSLLGIVCVGFGSALYITCGLGRGPRDGAMTGIHYKTGIRIGRVRLGIELTVLIIGWMLGGTVGLGTALFALLIGQAVAISLGFVSRFSRN